MTREDQNNRVGAHVLVVENDLAILKETCDWLTSDGYRVSAFSRAVGLRPVVDELRPDIVLIDVLMPDLNRRSLLELLARCRQGELPVLVLHSRLPERTLRAVAEIDGSVPVIQKTRSPVTFLSAFNTVVTAAQPAVGWPSLNPEQVVSGTHRVADEDTMNTAGSGGRH